MAAADGVVTDAGLTAGYGAWVKIRHSDGTVTLYGHVNTWLVSSAGASWPAIQIATIGNRGQSTGPPCTSGPEERHRLRRPRAVARREGLSPGDYVG